MITNKAQPHNLIIRLMQPIQDHQHSPYSVTHEEYLYLDIQRNINHILTQHSILHISHDNHPGINHSVLHYGLSHHGIHCVDLQQDLGMFESHIRHKIAIFEERITDIQIKITADDKTPHLLSIDISAKLVSDTPQSALSIGFQSLLNLTNHHCQPLMQEG